MDEQSNASNSSNRGALSGNSGSGDCDRTLSKSDEAHSLILTRAYAACIVILSIGLTILVITLPILGFLYPDKANAFLVLLASPVAVMVLANTFKLGGVLRTVDKLKNKTATLEKITGGPGINFVSPSQEGVKFICDFEGFMAHAYRDTGGILTIGYGTQIFNVDAVKYANGITEEQGMQIMQASLVKECRSLSQLPLNGFFQYQQDAIISLAYNIGYEAFVNSSIYTRLIHRATDLSPWLWYIRDAKKVPQDGLQMRREKELKLFIYGIY